MLCMLCYVILCILYLKLVHKTVYNKKLININWLILHSLQETNCDALFLLLLLQPTQMKFKQQKPQQHHKTTQFKYENRTEASRLHFSDLQYFFVVRLHYVLKQRYSYISFSFVIEASQLRYSFVQMISFFDDAIITLNYRNCWNMWIVYGSYVIKWSYISYIIILSSPTFWQCWYFWYG